MIQHQPCDGRIEDESYDQWVQGKAINYIEHFSKPLIDGVDVDRFGRDQQNEGAAGDA
jgi:hypothetical protein